MLRQRVLVAIVLLPIGLAAMYFGGPWFLALITLVLTLAAKEYTELFQAGGLQPARILVVGGTLIVALTRGIYGLEPSPILFSFFILISMTYHLWAYERGRDQSGTDFAVTVAGIFYIGWLGAYLISLRALPNGLWWLWVTLPAVWFADSGAYFIGKRFGRHKLSPRLSPKKTWEGYLGGILVGSLGAVAWVALWELWLPPSPEVTPFRAALLGLVIAVITPLGDLGESMIKRQVGIKDSSHLIPGHGGAFDRIDSWLWAGVIGYYFVTWFFG
ncbi:MAG: phosphatidate cytidylyltransferase [Chloroflexota bacterium]